MIKKILIENFRGFKSLQIENCKNFNLIIGKNNVGKTAFLEALFLHIGSTNPELPARINLFRGIGRILASAESMWSPLFYNFDSTQKITINSLGKKHNERKLEIRLASRNSVKFSKPKEKRDKGTEVSILTSTTPPDRIELKYYNPENDYTISYAIIDEEGIRFENPKNSDMTGIFVISKGKGGGREDSERYGQLDSKGKTQDILDILRKIEPRLKRLLTVPVALGSDVHGDIGLGKSLPVQLMGEGTTKLLSLSLAITAVPGGIVLIDEIENGLHYSVMKDVFKAICELANKYNVQIFATTHSNECVHSFFEAFTELNSNELTVIRLDGDNEIIKSVPYDLSALTTVFETGWEIRG